MKQSLFDQQIAVNVENQVMDIFDCEYWEIMCYTDSYEKKVVVFVLFHFFKYDWVAIGRSYKMTYLYVPTVSVEFEEKYKTDNEFRMKIDLILSNVNDLKTAI